ncbi:MAG: twin-arginine translocation signal domain-containing protein [Chthoniobacterales bacterium]|nr:twin-arginine translocation signal domain-containing protein [Chthoniobacterales bacterium]
MPEATPPCVAARDTNPPAIRRRSFLKFAGATILATTAAGLLPRRVMAQAQDGGVNLGTGDIVDEPATKEQILSATRPFIRNA